MERNYRRISFIAVIGYLALASVTSALAGPGDLDPTFGNGGVAGEKIGKKVSVRKVVLQPDGKIIVIGSIMLKPNMFADEQEHLFIRRYKIDGSLDTAFAYPTPGVGIDAAVQPDGKILVLGRAPNVVETTFGPTETFSPTVWRFTGHGDRDILFGDNGQIRFQQIDGPAYTGNYHIGAYADKIVIGYVSRTDVRAFNRYRISRISDTGQVDFTLVPSFKYSVEKAFAMKLDPANGSISAVGVDSATENVVARRYTLKGLVALGFGVNGVAVVDDCAPVEILPKDLVIQPDGKLLIYRASIGSSSDWVSVSRLSSDGSSDETFACVSGNIPPAVGDRLYLQPDGKFMFFAGFVAGAFRHHSDGNFDQVVNYVPFNSAQITTDQKIVYAYADYYDNTVLKITRRLLD